MIRQIGTGGRSLVTQLCAGAVRTLSLLVCAAAALSAAPAHAAPWTVSIDEQTGLPAVAVGGAAAVTPAFVFWGSNWSWANTSLNFRVVGPFDYAMTAQNTMLGFDLRATIRKQSERQLRYELEIDARQSQSNVIGGGMAFGFDLPKGARELGEPELLPDNAGWAWGRRQSSRIEVRFDPPLSKVFFERGAKSEIRAYFFQGEIPQGTRRHVVTVETSGDFRIAPTVTERYGSADTRSWPTGMLFDSAIAPWNIAPVDLSFLNAAERPAGKRGFVRAAKDSLTFEDGTPARFWGTNLTAYALFGTTRDNVRSQARRMSQLGFNLVRIHHHDSFWVNPNVFGATPSSTTRRLDENALAQLDWWIKCLKDEGIYVWLDLHVQRGLVSGDNIDSFPEIAKGRPTVEPKGYNYVNPSIRDAMKEFNAAYVNHLNRFTELRYKDDPAIVAMLITNENDVTSHFGNGLLPAQAVPWHSARFLADARAFAARNSLPMDAITRTWEPGPSKLFLNDLEQRFNANLIDDLLRLGVKVPIATTNYWGGELLSSLPALTSGDLIDVHSYGAVADLEKNPVYGANLVHWIAPAQVVGKPLSVTEWNVSPFPTPDRHSIPLYIAASADLQGWDALMQYAYTMGPLNDRGMANNWHAFNDPGLMATLPAAALLYRRQDVREADTTYVYTPSERDLFYRPLSPDNSAALRTASEKGKLLIAMPATASLPWLRPSDVPSDARIIKDPDQPLIDPSASEIISDSGELRRNWELGIFTINTARTQAATGWIGGRSIALPDVTFDIATPNASVAVQSLDGREISGAKSLLISLGARSVPAAGNRVPFSSEPVTGTLQIRAQPGLKLFRRVLPGEEREVHTDYRDGRYVVTLDRGLATYWLVLK